MKTVRRAILLIALLSIMGSCHTLNTVQTSVVKKFAGTAKEVSGLPYNVLYNYYSLKFKRRQLIPENYVTGDTEKEQLDQLAENVLSKIEEIRDEYHEDLKTANEVKTVYELLQTYITSLEKIAADKYSQDFQKKTAEMGNTMNGLVKKLNASPGTKVRLSLNPGDWLSSLATVYGRTKLKTKQADMLREYINQADTLVQAINLNYQEIQVPVMNAWFEEEKTAIRNQFKRSIAPYLQNLNRHPDSAVTIAPIEFYSRINPVYYELTDDIYKNQVLIQQTAALMKKLAQTHRSMKTMFSSGNSWISITEEVDGLKENLFVLKDLFNKESQEKFSFYKNFIMQNEKPLKDIITK
jgi:DNA-binding protein Fis